MALNPAYAQQGTRVLPFCVGYCYAQGDKVNSIVGYDGSTVEQYVLGEGEWDSCLYLSVQPADLYMVGSLVGGGYGYGYVGPLNQNLPNERPLYYHFHGGSFATVGLPLNLISIGPDQGSENWYQYFPNVTPPLCLSGMAYYFARRTLTTASPTMNPIGIYRTLRCREFDGNGNVINYGFTTNPTWQMIEAILRYQLKPQQPGIMGLTAAEKACFDWPAMVAHALRNGAMLPNGAPTYTGNFAFAADTTLGAMMEAMLRNCRSYKRERGGQIAFIGDDPRASVFTFSQRHLVPGKLSINKKDLGIAPNVYIPQYREMAIPAVTGVNNVSVTGVSGSNSNGATIVFTTNGPQPFFAADRFTYLGSSNDAVFGGEWQVIDYGTTTNGVTVQSAPPILNQFSTINGPDQNGSATGGYLGTQQSRFKQYAPNVVQHRAHQKMAGLVAPGIQPLPRITPVQYDVGNNTFDQSNRIMQYLCARELGTDGPNWSAPLKGTITAYLESVDGNNNALLAVEDGDLIALDDTASPEFAGIFEVVETPAFTPPLQSGGGAQITLSVQTYNPNAFPAISYPPGDSYQTLPGSLLPMADVFEINTPYWVLRATPLLSLNGGNLTLTLPDLSVLWMGQAAATGYAGVACVVPQGSQFILYLNVANQATPPTLTAVTTTEPPSYPLPYGQSIVFIGEITVAASGPLPTPNPNPGGTGTVKPQVQSSVVDGSSGTASTVTLVPQSGYVGSPPTSGQFPDSDYASSSS